MKRTVVAVFILILTIGCTSKYNRGTYDLYLIPEGYEGDITITYNVKDAPKLEREGEYDVIPVHSNGRYKTSNPMYDYGEVIDQYYYVDQKGKRTIIDPLCVQVKGTGGSTSSDGVETHFTKMEVTNSECGEDFMLGTRPNNQ